MILNTFTEKINQEIESLTFGSNPKELYEPLTYLLNLNGKRSRPSVCLLAYWLFKEDWQSVINPALAIEVFHNFTLMHDDIMDEAPLRRGKPTVHEKWNVNTGILSGDVMLIEAYKLFSSINEPYFKKVITKFNDMAAEVCEGQQLDMMFAEQSNVAEAEYLEMIRLKTSVLLGFSMELGSILAGNSEEVNDKLYQIGINMGLGFQIKDDLLDAYGDPKKFGKKVGGDILENKKTWLLIKAFELSKKPEELSELLELSNDKKVSKVLAYYNSLNIEKLASDKIRFYFKKAYSLITELPIENPKKEVLMAFAQNLEKREK